MNVVELCARAVLDSAPEWTGEHWDDERGQTVGEWLANTHLHDIADEIIRDAVAVVIDTLAANVTTEMIARGKRQPNVDDMFRAMLAAAKEQGL